MATERESLLEKVEMILNRAEREKRGLTDGERADYQKYMSQIADLDAQISRPISMGGGGSLIGMSAAETKRFSFLNVARALAYGDRNLAGLEREASDQVAKNLGRPSRGFYVPAEVAGGEQRDDVTYGGGTGPGGGLVATSLLSQDFIYLLRSKLVLRDAGVRVLTNVKPPFSIPSQTQSSTVTWVTAESAPVSNSGPAFSTVDFTLKTVGTYCDISHQMLASNTNTLDLEQLVRADFAAVVARELDRSALFGGGTGGEMLGICGGITGVNTVTLTATGGAPLTWESLAEFEEAVALDNADVNGLTFLVNPQTRRSCRTILANTGSGSQYLWNTDTPATPLGGYRALVSTAIVSDGTRNGASGLSTVVFGDFNAGVLALFSGGIQILADPYSLGKQGGLRLILLCDADFQVRTAGSFAFCDHVDTSTS
jgi:HK97 family phage major capsid protein